MSKYAVVVDDAGPIFCAYEPDLPGCVSAGYTVEEVTANSHEAIEFHLEGMRLHGDKLPEHMPIGKTVQVAS